MGEVIRSFETKFEERSERNKRNRAMNSIGRLRKGESVECDELFMQYSAFTVDGTLEDYGLSPKERKRFDNVLTELYGLFGLSAEDVYDVWRATRDDKDEQPPPTAS